LLGENYFPRTFELTDACLTIRGSSGSTSISTCDLSGISSSDEWLYVHDTADITTEIIRRIASDLENRRDLSASNKSDKFLNRTWIKFSLKREESVHLLDERRTGE